MAAADGEKEDKKRFVKGESIKNELPPQWKPAKGAEVSGFYRGFREIHPATAKEKFKIHILQLDEDMELTIRSGETEDGTTSEILEDGETISLSGKILDRLMSRVEVGGFVWVNYKGMEKVGKGKAHSYEVILPKGVKPLPEILDSDPVH
jgi:hypothetical protein